MTVTLYFLEFIFILPSDVALFFQIHISDTLHLFDKLRNPGSRASSGFFEGIRITYQCNPGYGGTLKPRVMTTTN